MEKVDVKNTGKISAFIKDYIKVGYEIKEKGRQIKPNETIQMDKKAYLEQVKEKIFSDGIITLIGDSIDDVNLLNEMTEEQVEKFLERPSKEVLRGLGIITSPRTLELIRKKDNRKTVIKAVNKKLNPEN